LKEDLGFLARVAADGVGDSLARRGFMRRKGEKQTENEEKKIGGDVEGAILDEGRVLGKISKCLGYWELGWSGWEKWRMRERGF
jgi:hypothetical protein